MKRSFFVLLAFLFALPARAECPIGDRPVVVGVPVSAPFVIEKQPGEFTGFDIELWRKVAEQLGCETTFLAITYDQRVPMLVEGTVDAVMGGMTVTAKREEDIDFSHGYYNAGQAMLTREDTAFDLFGFAKLLWQSTLKKFFIGLILFVLFWAHVIWGIEHVTGAKVNNDADKTNDVQFDRSYWVGVFQAAYFVNVTITTVGYGDITPKTSWGRGLTLAMMWTGIAYGTVFLGAIVAFGLEYANMTVAISPATLKNKPVAVIHGTTGEDAADALGAKLVPVTSVTEAIRRLKDGEVDAVIFDEPDLRYRAKQGDAEGMAVSAPFTEETYGIALRPASPLQDAVNHAVLMIREGTEYDEIKTEYLGSD